MPNNADLLKDAIRNKKQVTCYYDNLYREMCPHVIGWKGARYHVLSYQFAGESSKGLPPEGEWKCMDVNGISQLTLKEGSWHTDNRHTKPQTCVDLNRIELQVTY